MKTRDATRQIAVWTHSGRAEAIEMAARFIEAVAGRGIECLVKPDARDAIAAHVEGEPFGVMTERADPAVEVVVVFGGDGTILRAGEWALAADIPILGVNLGHVGFLAELETWQFGELVDRVVAHDYVLESRLTVSVDVFPRGAAEPAWSSVAINEVSLEKIGGQVMTEVIASVDHLPVSRWSCDGVLVSTPTGSTAYAFSAGGPVMWPDLEAFLLVPLCAHALFNRPMVLAPESIVCLDLVSPVPALLWCDGKRSTEVTPGSRIVVRRGDHELTMARLSVQPFTNRLVKKFELPVEGWRGGNGSAGSAASAASAGSAPSASDGPV
ncbi:MAG: NAD kinase [Propionibacteriaceae bacterium]|nr:NAD kinase [Propionibacteriaceae bacterium]